MDTTRGQETQAHGMDPPPRDRRFEPQVPSRAKRSVTYGVLLGFGALIAGLVIARGLVGYSVSEDGGTFVQDFSSHLMFTRGVLLEGLPGEVGASAYSVETHVRFMSDWTQGATEAVLPFGYSPTMLWLLLPLALVSLPAAYLIWSLLGATAAGSIVLNDRVNWIPGLAFFLTPVAITAIALGQTAVLGTAGVFFLATRTLTDPINQNRLGRGVVLAGILWALGAKPPLAVTGATAMLALGAVGPVVQAVGFTLLGAAVLTPWLGSGWLSDYWALMGTYDRVGA
ncbi:MAG: hypothetical protein HKO65_09470, partial [Gemmatimonadetes bacterium]|nr:hypothetical protein [Gemmatimonadota bacterium]